MNGDVSIPDLGISYLEIVIRLLVTVALCGVIGFEREIRDQSAGFRTHILVGLGATLFTLVSAYGFEPFRIAAQHETGRILFEPTRIAAQIVTGIGFLGAGAIIRRGMDVRGLTTAASLWAATAIGMAVGAGYAFGAAATTVIVLTALYALRKFRAHLTGRFRVSFGTLSIVFERVGESPSDAIEILERQGVEIQSMSAELEGGQAHYDIQLRLPPWSNAQEILSDIYALPRVKRVSISGLHELE